MYLACHLKFWACRKIWTPYANVSLLFFFCGKISMSLLFIQMNLTEILIQKISTWNFSKFVGTPSVHTQTFITVFFFFSFKSKIAFFSNAEIICFTLKLSRYLNVCRTVLLGTRKRWLGLVSNQAKIYHGYRLGWNSHCFWQFWTPLVLMLSTWIHILTWFFYMLTLIEAKVV